MRKLCALLLAMSALALLVIWMPGRDSERQLAVITEIAEKGIARVRAPSDRAATAPSEQGERRSRSFSPDVPLVPTERMTTSRSTPKEAVAELRPTASSTTDLRISGGVRQPAAPPGNRLTTTVPTDEPSRYELVRSLQRELRRVGCYWGEIDGSWGGGSKRAMGAFAERVNSALPIEQPDYIMLSLLQSHAGQTCGQGCPSGQAMSSGGRCVPNVVLAQSTKRATPPQGQTQTQTRTTTTTEGWTASVQPTPPEPSYAPTVAAAPLPGRMAVGGPRAGEAVSADPSGLAPPTRSSAAIVAPSRSAPRVRSNTRPVVIYRYPRPSYGNVYRAPSRTASRRLNFVDVFR